MTLVSIDTSLLRRVDQTPPVFLEGAGVRDRMQWHHKKAGGHWLALAWASSWITAHLYSQPNKPQIVVIGAPIYINIWALIRVYKGELTRPLRFFWRGLARETMMTPHLVDWLENKPFSPNWLQHSCISGRHTYALLFTKYTCLMQPHPRSVIALMWFIGAFMITRDS